MEKPKSVEVYTIGHSNLPIEQFLAALTAFEIALVIDVRTVPFSKYVPHFNREALERELSRRGIRYRWEGESLGGRPNDQSMYLGDPAGASRADFLKLVDYAKVAGTDLYRSGLERVLADARVMRVALMCSEEDPADCHRHHLIETHLPAEVILRHIRTKGGTAPRVELVRPEPAQLSLW